MIPLQWCSSGSQVFLYITALYNMIAAYSNKQTFSLGRGEEPFPVALT